MQAIALRFSKFSLRDKIFFLFLALSVISAVFFPIRFLEVATFVGLSLVSVAPIVFVGIVSAAWISASGASDRVAEIFHGNLAKTIFIASAVGAITPVCGVTVLPLMTGLLAAGVPLAAVMAFWLSSPIMDPAMLATTAATLGLEFAVGKTLAAFSLGVFGGGITALVGNLGWAKSPMRENGLVSGLTQCKKIEGLDFYVWQTVERRREFVSRFVATTKLILLCLIPAFAAEYLLNGLLEPEDLSTYLGKENMWAIPIAVFVGGPAYLDGYAALPLTRSLLDHGMTPGAALAFLVSGGVVSIWGAMAIFPVLRLRPFLLYLVLALSGSLIVGWCFDAILA